ncbi:MAG: hypothetical protein GDA50_06030 [Alphaproteobacteria bacterium GM202ARS2]|nr:hypothetical protein [Alphaproteobacteria bacterium GM202ARS2]
MYDQKNHRLYGTLRDKRDATYLPAHNPRIQTGDFTQVTLENDYDFRFTPTEGSRFSDAHPCDSLLSMYRFPKGTKRVFLAHKPCMTFDPLVHTSARLHPEPVKSVDFFQGFHSYKEGDSRLDVVFPTDLTEEDSFRVEGSRLVINYVDTVAEYLRGLSYALTKERTQCDYGLLGVLDQDMILPEDVHCITFKAESPADRLSALSSSFGSFVASLDSEVPSLSDRLSALALSLSAHQRHAINENWSLALRGSIDTSYLSSFLAVPTSQLTYHIDGDSHIGWTSTYLHRAARPESVRYPPPRFMGLAYVLSHNVTLQAGRLREKASVFGVTRTSVVKRSTTSFVTAHGRFGLVRNVALALSASVAQTSLDMVDTSFADAKMVSSAFQLGVRFRHKHRDAETSVEFNQPRYTERATFTLTSGRSTQRGSARMDVAHHRRPFALRIKHDFSLAPSFRATAVLAHGRREPVSFLVSLHRAY